MRDSLEAALRKAGHPVELPFLLLGAGDLARAIFRTDEVALPIGEPELKALLFARSPERTFAGLLHTRGLLATSPYGTTGAVKERPCSSAAPPSSASFSLASPLSKSSSAPAASARPRSSESSSATSPPATPTPRSSSSISSASRTLARPPATSPAQLDTAVPADAVPDTALADVLRARYHRSGDSKKGILLIDEADGLVQTDAAKGFPLLNAMRSLQAEGTCSFILAGFLYLYREAMNQRLSPLNFANLRLLGPLDPEAAHDLALVPMARLGVDYADPTLPDPHRRAHRRIP